MRIVSLLPACTEWVALFGAGDELVGRSHACDYPPTVIHLPTISVSADAASATTTETANALSRFRVRLDEIAALHPDLILTQTECGVTESDLGAAFAGTGARQPRIFSFDASSMKTVLDRALALGRTIGRTMDAIRAIGDLEGGLQSMRQRLGLTRETLDAPTVAVLESLDPLMAAGRWAPDLVDLAGGRPVCASPGARSVPIGWDELRAADPDIIVAAPCSMGLENAMRSVERLRENSDWSVLRAVRGERLFVCDGNAYFNRPGPRLYRSIELLAAAIHGEASQITIRPYEMTGTPS